MIQKKVIKCSLRVNHSISISEKDHETIRILVIQEHLYIYWRIT